MKLFLYMDEGALTHADFTTASASILGGDDAHLFGVTIDEGDPLHADAVALWHRYEQRVDEQMFDALAKGARPHNAEA